jgi:hypothetical protein
MEKIKIIIVNSKANKADIFAKNVTGEIYEEQVHDFIIHRNVVKFSSEDLEKIKYFDSGGVTVYSGMESNIFNESNKMNIYEYLLKKNDLLDEKNESLGHTCENTRKSKMTK